MVKRIAVILGILAMLVVAAGVSWGYTVSKWPAPGIPNEVYCGGTPCLVGGGSPDQFCLKGPVAPACEPPCIPGAIHCAMSIPFRAWGYAFAPLFTGQCMPKAECCPVQLGEPAYVTAAVPCTPVNTYVPPKGW